MVWLRLYSVHLNPCVVSISQGDGTGISAIRLLPIDIWTVCPLVLPFINAGIERITPAIGGSAIGFSQLFHFE